MRNITLALCSLAFSSIAFAHSINMYDGPQMTSREQRNQTAYENCVMKFKRATLPVGLDLDTTFYAGRSLKANKRFLYINGSVVKAGRRVRIGIACDTDYRGESVIGFKTSTSAHYAMNAGKSSPELLADE